jgi:hypothetical protein
MIRKNQILVARNHYIQTLSRSPWQKVWGGKWSARTPIFFTRPNKWKSFLKVMDFCKMFWEIFDFFQKSNYDWKQSKNSNPFEKPPTKELRVENDWPGPKKLIMRPKKWKSFLKVMDFCKTYWEIFDVLENQKTANFLGQFTTIYTWMGSKSHCLWWSAWKTTKMYISEFWFLKIHHTLFKMIGREFFKISKYVN